MAKDEMANQVAPAEPKKIRWGLRFSLGFATATAILAFATFELWKLGTERKHEIEQLRAQLDAMNTQMSKDQAAVQAMGQVTAAPDSAQITLLQQPGGPPGQGRVIYNARMGMGIYSGQIAPAPAGKSYQLWLVPASGAPVSAGVVDAYQNNGAMVMRFTPGLVAKAFALTMEPQGGVPQPTGPKILVGAAT